MNDSKLVTVAGVALAALVVAMLIMFYRSTIQTFTEQKSQNDISVRMNQPFDTSVFDGTTLTRTTVKALIDYGTATIPLDFDICDIEDDDKSMLYISELIKNANGVAYLVKITHKYTDSGPS